MKKKELWLRGWRACPGCGSFAVTESLTCSFCENKLRAKIRAACEIEAHWTHRFLFDWVPGVDDVLSNFILSMKGGAEREAWSHWAAVFLQTHADSFFSARDRAVCAAPSAHAGDDHASLFAKALAEQLGWTYLGRPLSKTRDHSMRGLSRKDRLRRDDFVKSTEFRKPRERKIILVDDVLTTGATARAVRHALGSPVGFEVWTLAARSRLSCGVLEPMIGN